MLAFTNHIKGGGKLDILRSLNEQRGSGTIPEPDMAYLDAYDQNELPVPRGNLWAGRPIRREYQAMLDFLLGLEVAKRHYSAETLEKELDGLLEAVLCNREQLEEEMRDIVTALNRDLRTRLYLPIEGIDIDKPSYDIGTLRLVKMDDAAFNGLIVEPFQRTMTANPRYTAEDAAAWVELHRSELTSMRDTICAEVPTSLDIPRTFKFAQESAIGSLCDFLQLAASLFVPHNNRLKIAWATDGPTAFRHSFAASNDQRSNRHRALASAGRLFTVTDERIQKLRDLKLDRIANLVGREAPTEFDEMLQLAVRWFH